MIGEEMSRCVIANSLQGLQLRVILSVWSWEEESKSWPKDEDNSLDRYGRGGEWEALVLSFHLRTWEVTSLKST